MKATRGSPLQVTIGTVEPFPRHKRQPVARLLLLANVNEPNLRGVYPQGSEEEALSGDVCCLCTLKQERRMQCSAGRGTDEGS